MTYNSTTIVSDGTGANVMAQVASQLGANGYTQSGSTWGKTFGSGRVISLDLSSQFYSYSSWYYGVITINNAAGILYAYFPVVGAAGMSGAPVNVTVIGGQDLLYIAMRGPDPGAQGAYNATYGSPKHYMLITSVVPYYAAELSDGHPEYRQAVVTSSNYYAYPYESVPSGYIRRGLDGSGWAPFELLTMRPAIQDTPAVGDSPPRNRAYNGSDYIAWPYVICESNANTGIRGRLNGIYYGGENYLLAGDDTNGQAPASNLLINGKKHYYERPYFVPNTSPLPYSPLGLPTATTAQSSASFVGGPRVYILGEV